MPKRKPIKNKFLKILASREWRIRRYAKTHGYSIDDLDKAKVDYYKRKDIL